MPVIEPVITLEKLRLLLAEQHESELLDYKRTLDLTARRDICELAKDVGAMQIDGGFIVIGADDHGQPTDEIAPEQIKQRLFDQATIQAKIRKYLPEPFDVRSAVHEIDGKHVALIYIGPSPDGFCIFRADGNYEGGTAVGPAMSSLATTPRANRGGRRTSAASCGASSSATRNGGERSSGRTCAGWSLALLPPRQPPAPRPP
jgi:hypothetical protein